MLLWIVQGEFDKNAAQIAQSAFKGCSGSQAQGLMRAKVGAVSMDGEM